MKLLLTFVLTICCLSNSQAQTHTFKSGWCRLAKPVKGSVQGEVASFVCQACAKDKETEQKARATEDKRRADVLAAAYKAKKDAEEKTRLENIRLAKEEEKRVKDKDIADKIAQDALLKKYKDIADKGKINSTVKGEINNSNVNDALIPFSDAKRRVYGLKLDNTEILSLPFENYLTKIIKLNGTSFFEVINYSKDPRYNSNVYANSCLMNNLGEKIKVNGISEFDAPIRTDNNTIILDKNISASEECDNSYCYYLMLGRGGMFQDKSSVLAYLKTQIVRGGGLQICGKYATYHITRFKVDFNCKFLEKTDGYVFDKFDTR